MTRLNGEIQKAVYDIIAYRLKNPDITEMVSITRVDCAPDISHAKVFISVFSNNQARAEKTYQAICESVNKIRYELAHKMAIRTVPELHFYKDESMAYSDKINKLLNGLDIKPQEDIEE